MQFQCRDGGGNIIKPKTPNAELRAKIVAILNKGPDMTDKAKLELKLRSPSGYSDIQKTEVTAEQWGYIQRIIFGKYEAAKYCPTCKAVSTVQAKTCDCVEFILETVVLLP